MSNNCYPLSSCSCYDIPVGAVCPLAKKGIPSNMSIANCSDESCLEHVGTQVFRPPQVQPNPEKKGFSIYNPQALTEKLNPTFFPLEKPPFTCGSANWAMSPVWLSNDPRLNLPQYDNKPITLDRPPVNDVNVKLDEIAHDKRLNAYGQRYKSYSDISAGQYVYYVDESIEDPFFLPTYATSATTSSYLYKDPMGSVKPAYYRTPLNNDPKISQPVRDNYVGCLSFIQDSTEHRENIMASQMAKRNQERWEPRWTNLVEITR